MWERTIGLLASLHQRKSFEKEAFEDASGHANTRQNQTDNLPHASLQTCARSKIQKHDPHQPNTHTHTTLGSQKMTSLNTFKTGLVVGRVQSEFLDSTISLHTRHIHISLPLVNKLLKVLQYLLLQPRQQPPHLCTRHRRGRHTTALQQQQRAQRNSHRHTHETQHFALKIKEG